MKFTQKLESWLLCTDSSKNHFCSSLADGNWWSTLRLFWLQSQTNQTYILCLRYLVHNYGVMHTMKVCISIIENDVLGQVKLLFRSTRGQEKIICRSRIASCKGIGTSKNCRKKTEKKVWAKFFLERWLAIDYFVRPSKTF